MILDKHEIAHVKAGVNATGGVRHHKLRDTQPMHEADGKRDLLGRVSLVGMQPSLHADDRATSDRADDEATRMRRRR